MKTKKRFQVSSFRSQTRGFTLIELMVIVGILLILTVMAVPSFRFFQKESDLNNSTQKLISILRLAQNKTLASEGASSWGVYFSTSTIPHQYILFKGIDFVSREISSDKIHKLPKTIIISEINLGGGNEVVFDRVTGTVSLSGSTSLELAADPTKTRTIYIESFGQVGLTGPQILSDENRIKDSRHLHFDYSRNITTSTENLVLTFEGGIIETIIIADNMKAGQIYWEGEIDVAGLDQKLKIHTHRLNDPSLGTQFSVHRDRRYNNKTLKIDIDDSPDPDSGTLVEYSADGLTTISISFYVTNLQWQ